MLAGSLCAAEVTLAAVVMVQWYLVSSRALARTRRRSDSAGPQLPIALPTRRRGGAPLPLSQLGRTSRGARTGHGLLAEPGQN
jgi:hypothetical protein